MDLLDKRLDVLNVEIKGVAANIKELYDKLDSMQDPALREELKERILRLETKEKDLMAKRRELSSKLQPGGMPFNGLRMAYKHRALGRKTIL